MNLNGSLKEIFLNLYQKDTFYYNESFMQTKDYYINYQGQVTFLDSIEKQNWMNIQKKFINGQFAELIYDAQNNYSSSIMAEIEYLAHLIKNSDDRLSLISLESLNKLLEKNITLNDLKNYSNLIDFLALYLKQLNSYDITIAFLLFLEKKAVTLENILAKKRETFKILPDDLKEKDALSLYNLGQFVSPNRLANISADLLFPSTPTFQILPLYLLEPNSLKAKKIITYYQNNEYSKVYQEVSPSLLKLSKK